MYNDQEKIIGSFFDDCAHNGEMTSFTLDEHVRLTAFFDDWNIHPGEYIFEPGCGSGRLTELLAQKVGKTGSVYACDLSAVMVKLAGKRNLPQQVKLCRGSVVEVPVEDGFFDKVILFQVFPHFDDRPRALREIYRVLKPDGDLWFNHLKSREEINTLHKNASAVVISHHIPEDNELRALLESSGFRVDGIRNSTDGYKAHACKL